MDADAAIAQCRERVAAPGSDLYYATLFLTPNGKARLVSLHALAAELSHIPRTISDAGVARLKLAWWHDELARVANRQPRHPIGIALVASGAAANADSAAPASLADACESWLARPGLATMQAVADAHEHFEGTLWRESARVLGVDDAATLSVVTSLGTALGIIDTLHRLREQGGIARLPADLLAKLGSHTDTLIADGQPDTIAAIATHMGGHARAIVLSALAALPEAQRAATLPALVMTDIALKTLAEMQADGFRLLERRIVLTPLRKLWIAITTRRRERRLVRRLDRR